MKKFKRFFAAMVGLCLVNMASAGLVHQYTFEGDATDSVGSVDGVLEGGAAVVDGQLVLTSGSEDFMSMDAAAIAMNEYSSVSIEAWYTPEAGTNGGWSMLAYFGDSTGIGVNYLFMSTARADNVSRAAISTNNTSNPWATESGANGTEYDDAVEHHMVATLTSTTISLYIDGAFISSADVTGDNAISAIGTSLAYLGKGGYADPVWNGSFDEFNIYNNALSATDVAANFAAGTSVVPEPATLAILGMGSLAMLRRRR